jgi:transcriptional regulator with XRE-family HTH domain
MTLAPVDDQTEQKFLTALGTRLRLLRVARGQVLRQIANAAGIHRTVIGRIERGEVNFGIDYLRRLAQALGLAASWLLPGTDQHEWEAAFIAESIRAPHGPYVPHDLVAALDAAAPATAAAFLAALEARAGEDIPADEVRALWERMTREPSL